MSEGKAVCLKCGSERELNAVYARERESVVYGWVKVTMTLYSLSPDNAQQKTNLADGWVCDVCNRKGIVG